MVKLPVPSRHHVFMFSRIALIAAALFCLPGPAAAQTDEIQVYTGALADVGVFNLTWHNNFTPIGQTTPAFPGAVVADKSFNGVTEWALGVTRWFEAGLYLPLYSRDNTSGWGIDGFKLRALFAVPKADDRRFFYGANFEFSVNAKRWNSSRFSSEVRPIIGWHLKPVDIILNPIVDTEYDGFKNLEFVPAARVAYNFSDGWAVAAEEYDDFGPVHDFLPSNEQVHQLYGVVDKTWKSWDIEGGVGVGMTGASDRLTLKLILSRDLNKPR
ncbi:MAG TPA: hypothetical protein VGG73_21935 [Vicinamibacterales bacterium]